MKPGSGSSISTSSVRWASNSAISASRRATSIDSWRWESAIASTNSVGANSATAVSNMCSKLPHSTDKFGSGEFQVMPHDEGMGTFGIAGLWLVLALVLVVSILVGAGGIWLAHRTPPEQVDAGHNGALSPFLTCVGLVYGALLGFTIVVAWEQFSSAEANVSNEASTLTTMYRQTVGMPGPEQTRMRQLLRNYTTAVAGPEWEKAVRDGGGTEGARDALNEMYRVLGIEQSSVESNPISQRVSRQGGHVWRRSGVSESWMPNREYPGCCGPVCSSAVSSWWRSAVSCVWAANVRHLLLLSAVAVLLGLLLFIVFWLDHPFGNQLGVTSEPFEQSLNVFDSIDRGT